MKIYRYYLISKYERRCSLYAWTCDKEIASLFKKYRDMSMFKESIIEIKKSEYHQTVNRFSDQLITIGEFKTVHPITQKTTRVKIPTTWDEQKMTAFALDNVLQELKPSVENIYPELYNEDIQEALFDLGYFMFHQWLYINGYIYEPLHPMFDTLVDPDVISDMKECIAYDEYSILMQTRGNTFRKEDSEG